MHTFEVTQETIFPVHRPLRLRLHNAPLPTTVFKARCPMDPIPHLAHDLSSEEGASYFKRAQAESFAAQDEFLTQAALLKDTSALWKLWSAAMEQAYLACLQPQALAKHGVNAFTGHGLTRIQEKILLPPKPRLVGRDHVADTHASPRGDKARKLARAARMRWLQLQKNPRRPLRCGTNHRYPARGRWLWRPLQDPPCSGCVRRSPSGGAASGWTYLGT